MKSLDQIRAAHALESSNGIGAGQRGGDAISGFPTMVKTDGLLAALAFAVEWKDQRAGRRKHEGEFSIANAIASHLRAPEIGIVQARDADQLVSELADAKDASQLRRATAEALAYLNFLKRFVA